MKKTMIVLSAIFALMSCNKVAPETETSSTIDASKLVFDFTIHNANDTKAVKSDWEDGDKVFIFFNGLTTAHVTTVYDGTSWTPTLNGTGSLPTSGKLTAVYLPYGNSLTASYASNWTFSETQYTYYMVAENVDYTVSSATDPATLSAEISMNTPDGFAHFYIADAAAGCTLMTDAVIPTGIASISSAGAVTETSDKAAGDAMTGYAYSSGYSFSGKLGTPIATYNGNGTAESNKNGFAYYFTYSDGTDNYAFFKHQTTAISGHPAINLPTLDSEKWFQTGSGHGVAINGKIWATVNVGATNPWDSGNYIISIESGIPSGWRVPSETDFYTLINNITKYWTSVKGMNGYIVVDTDAENGNFIFMPAAGYLDLDLDFDGNEVLIHGDVGSRGFYWSSSVYIHDENPRDVYGSYSSLDFGSSYYYFNDDSGDWPGMCVRLVKDEN